MLRAVMTAPGKIEFRHVDKPTLLDSQLLIQVKRIGICGSDIHVFHGKHPYTTYPVVQGHEVSGVIAEIGKGIREFSPGDLVTLTPQVTCGVCYACRHGKYHICDNLKVMGFQTSGAAQEFIAVEANQVLRLPNNLSLDQAAMIEPTAVGVHALRRAGDMAGNKVLVLGAGTIGNLVGQVAKALGAKVVVSDISEYKLAKARQVGLDCAINTAKQDLGHAILHYFGADKADVILECVGVQETIDQAISNARKGSTVVIVGVFGQKPQVDLGLVQDHELTLIGTLMYQKSDYERAIELIANGKLYLESLVTNHFPFANYLDAYHLIEETQGNVMKVMVTL